MHQKMGKDFTLTECKGQIKSLDPLQPTFHLEMTQIDVHRCTAHNYCSFWNIKLKCTTSFWYAWKVSSAGHKRAFNLLLLIYTGENNFLLTLRKKKIFTKVTFSLQFLVRLLIKILDIYCHIYAVFLTGNTNK